MYKKLKVGALAIIRPNNGNDNYEKYRGMDLRVTHIARSKEDHPGYDSSVNEALCDFEVAETKEAVPFSLYEYEFALY